MSIRVIHLDAFFFFFNDTATTEIYTLSLHDALPICIIAQPDWHSADAFAALGPPNLFFGDRKSTRLNSSHLVISYAVFCLKKKKNFVKIIPTVDTLQTNVLHIHMQENHKDCDLLLFL